eukprot:302379-Amphidinium_carterae.1
MEVLEVATKSRRRRARERSHRVRPAVMMNSRTTTPIVTTVLALPVARRRKRRKIRKIRSKIATKSRSTTFHTWASLMIGSMSNVRR